MSEQKRKRNVGPDLAKIFIGHLKNRGISIDKKKRGVFIINDIPLS